MNFHNKKKYVICSILFFKKRNPSCRSPGGVCKAGKQGSRLAATVKWSFSLPLFPKFKAYVEVDATQVFIGKVGELNVLICLVKSSYVSVAYSSHKCHPAAQVDFEVYSRFYLVVLCAGDVPEIIEEARFGVFIILGSTGGKYQLAAEMDKGCRFIDILSDNPEIPVVDPGMSKVHSTGYAEQKFIVKECSAVETDQ